MGFNHTIYLKGKGDEGFYQCGARDFEITVKHFGTKTGEYTYEFSHYQISRLLASLMEEFIGHYEAMDKAYDDFCENVKYNEEINAEMRCIESYAILRSLHNKMEELPDYYHSQFGEPVRLYNLVKNLAKIVGEMKENDILVWEAG